MLSRPTEEASAPQRHVVGMRSVLVPALADLVVLQIITAGPARTSSYANAETSRSVSFSGASLKSDQISAIPTERSEDSCDVRDIPRTCLRRPSDPYLRLLKGWLEKWKLIRQN